MAGWMNYSVVCNSWIQRDLDCVSPKSLWHWTRLGVSDGAISQALIHLWCYWSAFRVDCLGKSIKYEIL